MLYIRGKNRENRPALINKDHIVCLYTEWDGTVKGILSTGNVFELNQDDVKFHWGEFPQTV